MPIYSAETVKIAKKQNTNSQYITKKAQKEGKIDFFANHSLTSIKSKNKALGRAYLEEKERKLKKKLAKDGKK